MYLACHQFEYTYGARRYIVRRSGRCDRSNERLSEQSILQGRSLLFTNPTSNCRRTAMKVEREIGKMLGKNSRAAKLFSVKVTTTEENGARIEW